MIAALVTGSLFRAPEQRTSKAGRPFVTATIKAKDGDGFLFVRLVVFSESASAELMRLSDGESLSAQGSFKAEIYRPEGGEPKLSLSIVADKILALRQPPKEREAKPKPPPPDPRSKQDRCAGSWQRPADGPSDDIDF
jgi:Single-strand binding protein family